MVEERCDLLRERSFSELKRLKDTPVEYLTIGARKGKISIIVDDATLPNGGMRIVVQGFLKKRFLPMGWNVALDGFHKYPDETTAPLTREELWEFD